jgi:hypothetical protein
MLTEVGRLVAISSTDGAVQWAEYLGNSPNTKIIVRNMLEREIEADSAITQQIAAIADDTIYMINPATGLKGKEYFMTPLTEGSQRDFLLLSLGESRSQFILAISS